MYNSYRQKTLILPYKIQVYNKKMSRKYRDEDKMLRAKDSMKPSPAAAATITEESQQHREMKLGRRLIGNYFKKLVALQELYINIHLIVKGEIFSIFLTMVRNTQNFSPCT